jgi:hypothetical protein
MGGKGSGGSRAGAGRRSQNQALGELRGSRRTRARAKKSNQGNQAARNQNGEPPATSVDAAQVVPDVQIPDPPGSLTLDELAVWNEIAPLAAKEGTLSQSTAVALRDLCEAIVLKRKLLRQVGDDGIVVTGKGGKRAHPLLTQFRGLMQRVEAGMIRFKLAPMGKEVVAPEKPADPFAEFDSSQATTGDGETIN